MNIYEFLTGKIKEHTYKCPNCYSMNTHVICTPTWKCSNCFITFNINKRE